MTIVIGIIVFSCLVLFHELGHFLAAKSVGVGVIEFSLGMGPRLLSVQGKRTRYSLKLIPFGGSCSMVGEEAAADTADSFSTKGPWARALVIAAGPFFNLLFAFLVSVILVISGGMNKPLVYRITTQAAYDAGLRPADEVLEINGRRITIGRDISLLLDSRPLEPGSVTVTYRRDGEVQEVSYDTHVSFYYLGLSYYNNDEPPALAQVDTDCAAEAAGLQAGDVLLSIDGVSLSKGSDFADYLSANALDGRTLTVVYSRDGVQHETALTPLLYEAEELGFYASNYYDTESRPGVTGAVKFAAAETGFWVRYSFYSLKLLFSGSVGVRELSGPVGIVNMIGDVVDSSMESGGFKEAFDNLMNMMVLLNANLGVMNLLPIPALDGGRLFFILVELLRRRPIPPEKENTVHLIGLGLLLLIMLLIFTSDILKLFGI